MVNSLRKQPGCDFNTQSNEVKSLLTLLSGFPCQSTEKGGRGAGGKKSRVTLQCSSASQEVAVAAQPATVADLPGEMLNKTRPVRV